MSRLNRDRDLDQKVFFKSGSPARDPQLVRTVVKGYAEKPQDLRWMSLVLRNKQRRVYFRNQRVSWPENFCYGLF